MQSNQKVSGVLAFLILGLLALTWGTSFILIKRALNVFSPYQIAGLRVAIASLAFVPILLYHRNKINWSKWPLFIAVGLCGTMIPALLFPIAQTRITSSMAGILNAIAPIFTLVIGIVFYKKIFEWNKGIGIALGFIGAFILITSGQSMGIGRDSWYGIFAVAAGILYSWSSNIIENNFSDMSPLNISAASFGSMAPIAITLLVVFDAPGTITNDPNGFQGLGYVAILAVFSTVMASIVFFYLIQKSSAVFASTVAYLIPIVALMWGVIDGEIITVNHFIGMALIMVGVYYSRN